MSVKATSTVWDHFPEGGGPFLTALCLADHADHEGGNIFPSVARIAEKTQQAPRTVQRHLDAMRASGWLVLEQQATGRPGQANQYRIPIEKLSTATGRVTKLHPSGQEDGCQNDTRGVTKTPETGDTAMSPKQKITTTTKDSADADAPASRRSAKRPVPKDWQPTASLLEWATQKGYGPTLTAHLEFFRNQAEAKGYQYSNIDMAFRNCLIADWGMIRQKIMRTMAPGGTPTTKGCAACGQPLTGGYTQTSKGPVCSTCEERQYQKAAA